MDAAVVHKSACILCYINCGIEVETVGREITKVRGDAGCTPPPSSTTSIRRRSSRPSAACIP